MLSATTASLPTSVDAALELCRPALARKAQGEIQAMSPSSVRKKGRKLIIEGQLTAFIGMAPPQPGSASTHHLIRAEFDFRCQTRAGRVRKVSIAPHQP